MPRVYSCIRFSMTGEMVLISRSNLQRWKKAIGQCKSAPEHSQREHEQSNASEEILLKILFEAL